MLNSQEGGGLVDFVSKRTADDGATSLAQAGRCKKRVQQQQEEEEEEIV